MRVGAQVVLLWNVDTSGGLVNGSRGIVVDFQTSYDESNPRPGEILPVVRFSNGKGACCVGFRRILGMLRLNFVLLILCKCFNRVLSLLSCFSCLPQSDCSC